MTERTHLQTLSDRLEEQASKAPPEVLERIKAAQAGIAESGLTPGLDVGEKAPDFSLPDATGRTVSLYERLRDGPVVLSFYRGEWCPYCNIELRALQEALPDIREQHGSLVAISPQSPGDADTVIKKQNLEFDVLSDADQDVIKQYRVQYRVPDAVQEISLNILKNDVSQRNADGTWNLPIPATFVIDTDAIVRARHVSTNYMTSRMEPSEIVKILMHVKGEGREPAGERR